MYVHAALMSLSVCFCLSVSLSQLFSHVPDTDIQCSGSELHFMFCVDSCSVFRDLILYLAQNRDLLTMEGEGEGGGNTCQPEPNIVQVGRQAHCTYFGDAFYM